VGNEDAVVADARSDCSVLLLSSLLLLNHFRVKKLSEFDITNLANLLVYHSRIGNNERVLLLSSL
jgi:hypothetical protein